VSAEMNERPRKTLNWLEPREVLAQLLSESSPLGRVATTD
jgi:IS30 family transposase